MSMVIYAVDEHRPGHPSFDRFPEHCVADTWGALLRPDLYRAKDARYIHKGHRLDTDGFSAFDDDDLLELLHDHQIQDLVIMGVALEFCIRETVLDALKHELTPIVILDCCYAVDQEKVYPVLAELMGEGAHVQHSNDIPPSITLPYNTAFMVVDVQNDFFWSAEPKAGLPILGASRIIPSINEVLTHHGD